MPRAEEGSRPSGQAFGAPGSSSGSEGTGESPPSDVLVGSPEHLRWNFVRAAAAADRAVGPWLARSTSARLSHEPVAAARDRAAGELWTLRALVRRSAAAYVRQLRSEGVTPERMLVLVKAVTATPRPTGFGGQELMDDVVRWSIEAYFDE